MQDLNCLSILNQLRQEKETLQSVFGVTKIGLFGSYVKEQAHPDSDIDLLVEFQQPSFDSLAGLYLYLEKKFDRKIEIVRKSSHLNPRFVKRIEKEIIYA
jgi:predicted nucleotidyltransferase